MSGYSFIWLGILIGAIGAEAATMALTAIWFMPAALVSMILSLFGVKFYWQLIAFLVISLGLLIATKPLCKKFLYKGKDERTNAEALIGRQGVVTEAIENLQETGAVRINGLTWSARSHDGSAIPAGTVVTIREISGVKLIVSVD